MTSSYDNDLRLNEMATGDQSGAWGTVTNLNLEMIAEAFSYGTRAIANAATDNITLADGALDADRSMYLRLSGGGQACTVTFLPATISKVWLIENATSATLTMKQGSSPAGIAIPAGQVKMIATDGGGSTNGVVYDLLTDVNLAGTTVMGDIAVGGKVITMTGSSGDTATLTVAADGALAIATTDAAAAAANISITADGTFTAAGTTITLDSAGDIILDADGADVIFKDGGTSIGTITNASSDLVIKSNVQDKDILLKGDDGGTEITALSLDMSAAGAATFNSTVTRALTRGSIDVGNSSGVSTPLAIGGANTLLQSDGTDASWATVSGSDSRQSYVTNATVAARAAVFLNSDGTVDQTGTFPLADNDVVVSTFSAELGGNYGVQYNGHAGSSAYKDSGTVADRRHVTIYKYRAGSSAANARYVVSAVAADGTMTHGTPTAFNSSGPMNNCNVKYNANIDRFIAVYDYGGYESAGNYGAIAVAVGTLDASNNTVAWTHTTNLGNAGSAATRGFTYYDSLNSIESPSFDIAQDGSHLMMSHMGNYNNEANESNSDRLSVKVATINAGNNTVSGGSWKDVLVSSGTKYNRPNLTPSSLHWHQNSSQYILCAANTTATGSPHAYGDQQVFLFTVSGNTPTQVNYALGPLTMSGLQTNYAAPQISWYDVTSTKCWGVGINTGHISHSINSGGAALGLYEMTVGSGSISNIKGRPIALKDTSNFSSLGSSTIGASNAVATASVVYDSSGTAYILYKVGDTSESDGIVAVIELAYDETNIGALISLKINGVSSDLTVPYPKGGGFVTYDTGRDFLFTLGTDLFVASQTTASDYRIVAQTINVANNGSGLNPIGIHDSSSSASSGDTITVAQAGSLVSGFSGLNAGASYVGAGKRLGYAISATEVFTTADGNGG